MLSGYLCANLDVDCGRSSRQWRNRVSVPDCQFQVAKLLVVHGKSIFSALNEDAHCSTADYDVEL